MNDFENKVQDASTIQKFSYGMMGEVIENIRTFVVPGGQDYTFAMNFEYDSWNRIKTMTYPDGEVVDYGYDIAGQLSSVVGDKGTNTYRYIEDIYYDQFGSRTRVDYGNGTQSRYTYDAVMRQLTNLKTYDASSNLIQDISYNYDDVSNISTIANAAGSVSGLGGAYSYSYQYDSLYRLVNSAGSFTDNSQNTYPYTQSMNYTASGNILNKQTIADKLLDGNALSVNNQYNYQYDNHRITQIQMTGGSKAFNWDLNGNMITATQTTDITTTRSLCWDEENRLMAVHDHEFLSDYIYDAGGERVWKITGAIDQMTLNGTQQIDVANLNNKTLYTSPYMVVTDQEYTKHYYAGSERIASKIGAGFDGALVDIDVNVATLNSDVESIANGLINLLEESNTCAQIESGNVTMPEPNLPIVEELRYTSINNIESDMYFYHSDHLGSSSWITDASGAVNQHLQYLPYGEDFIYQRNSSWNIPYTFSGKEKDSETEYSYFGARYYSSDLSIWLSVDPLASKYPSTSSYMYVRGNPVMLIDPNGLWDKDAKGNWTATKGDSWWKLHEQSGMSWKETMAFAKNYNAARGRDNWKTVRVGDKVNLSGNSDNSSDSPSTHTGVFKSQIKSNSSSSSSSNTSNSPSNLVMEEELGFAPTPYGDFATSVSSTLETNPNARYTVNVDRFMNTQSLTYTSGMQNYTVGPNGVSSSNGILSVGVNNKGQFIIGVSTPNVNGVSYSAEIRMNYQQASNAGRAAANAALVTGGIVYLRRLVPAPFPIVIP